MRISPAFKVGILTIISIAILVLSVMWIKGRALSSGMRIDVVFQDVDGMRPGSGVQIMGLRVGQIEEIIPYIRPTGSFVKVRFVITEPNIKIPEGSEISIQQSGIIGEKLIEITPPQIRYVYLPLKNNHTNFNIEKNSPVELFVSQEDETEKIEIGVVKELEAVERKTLEASLQETYSTDYLLKVGYIINKVGVRLPAYLEPKIISEADGYKLLLNTPYSKTYYEQTDAKYTVIEPVRLREFLNLQLEAAKALNETNNKINAVLSDDVILDVKDALRNVKDISYKTSSLIEKATTLVDNSRDDINSLLKLANQLTEEMALLANNVNEIAGDPEFKKSVISLTKSLNESSTQISSILNDTKTQETLSYLNDTMKNVSEISKSLNTMTQDEQLKSEVYETVANLNKSLSILSDVLGKIDNMTPQEKAKIVGILDDAADTSKNLKTFSEKLNKRFLLFRLMF